VLPARWRRNAQPGFVPRPRLTGEAAVSGIPIAYLGRLAGAFAQDPAATGPRDQAGTVIVAGLVEPLSHRELEVLRLLASGKPNQQIAEELVVALNTVKKHVGHILSKLGPSTAPRRPPAPASSACCTEVRAARYPSQGSFRARPAGRPR